MHINCGIRDGDQRRWWHYTLAAGIDPKALLVPEISIKGTCTQMEYLVVCLVIG